MKRWTVYVALATALSLGALTGCEDDPKPADKADTSTATDAQVGDTQTTDTQAGTDAQAGDTATTDTTTTDTAGTDATAGDTTGATDATADDTTVADTTTTDTTVADTTTTDTTAPDVAADVPPPAPTCEAYCDLVMKSCTGDLAQYKDAAECVNYCKNLGKIPVGTADDKAGNTIGCRTYHATVAGQSAENAKTHCVHTGRSGGNVCGTWCENFCHLHKVNCTGGNSVFASDADCGAACAKAKTDGQTDAVKGDQIQCRIYHLGVAGTDATFAATHCPHAKVPNDPGGPCTDAVASKTWEITTKGFAFDPPELTISMGDSVTFKPGPTHTATEVEKSVWDANGATPKVGGFNVVNPATQTVKFDKMGDVYYVCVPHAGGGMKGKIIVK